MSIADQVQTSASDFIKRWEPSGSAERGNFHSFAAELCELLGVPRPDPQRPNGNAAGGNAAGSAPDN